MGTTNKPQVMAGMTFKLLGATLNAGFTKDENGKRIFAHQDISVPNDGITVEKLVADINELIGNSSANKIDDKAISDKLAPLGNTDPFVLTNVKFILTTAYFDMKIPKSGPREVEYAFRLDVDAKGLINEQIDIINIDRLTIAVWNTENKDIIKQLNLTT